MFTIQQSVTIGHPVSQVFAFLAYPSNVPNWRPDVLEVRSIGGPLRLGSEFDEVISFGGRQAQRFRVVVFEPNQVLEVAAVAGFGIRPTQRYILSNNGDSTTVEIHVAVRTQGLFRILEPLLSILIPSKWRAYTDRLRGLLENESAVRLNELERAQFA